MQAFELKRDSWHYRLGTVFDGEIGYSTDICSYIRYVLRGALLGGFAATVMAGVAALVVGILFSWGVVAYYVYQNWGTGAWYVSPEFRTFFKVGVIFGIVFAAAGSVFGGIAWVGNYREKARTKAWLECCRLCREGLEPPPPPPPSFLALAYRRFKDKTCVRVKIVDKFGERD